MGDLANKVRAKYPGAYNDMNDQQLEAAVIAKYPQYKDLAAPSQPSLTNQGPSGNQTQEGFGGALGSDLLGMAKGAGQLMVTGGFGLPYQAAKQSLADYQSYKMTGKTLAERDAEARAAAGHGKAYQVGAGVNEALGVNVKGMEQAADQGDMGGVLGHAAAVPVASAVTAGTLKGGAGVVNKLKAGAGAGAEVLYRSALKPSTTIPLEKSTRIVQTGLDNKIPISAEGVEKLNALQAELNKSISGTVSSDPMAFINKSKVAQRLKGTYQDFAQQVSPTPDINRIKKVGYDFMKNNPDQIPAAKAQEMKQGTYQSIKSAAYGEMKTATVEAQKALARGIKEELEVQFPEIKSLNSKEGRFIELDSVLEKAVNRIGNHQVIGLGTPLATGAGGAIGGGPGAVAAFTIKQVLDNPAVKSKLAIALNSSSKGRMGLPGAHARIAAYSSALGAGASSERENGAPSN